MDSILVNKHARQHARYRLYNISKQAYSRDLDKPEMLFFLYHCANKAIWSPPAIIFICRLHRSSAVQLSSLYLLKVNMYLRSVLFYCPKSVMLVFNTLFNLTIHLGCATTFT